MVTGAEVGGEAGHWGGRNDGKKEKQTEKRFVSADESAKFFMCFWGNKIEFAVLTLDCKSRRLLRAAVGSAFALGGWGVGGVRRQLERVLAPGSV